MFNLAKLFIEITADSSGFKKGMDDVRGTLTKANVAAGTFVGNLASSLATGALRLGGGLFSGTIGSAAELGETMNMLQVTMGASSGKIIAESDKMAASFGTNKNAYISAAASFGTVFKSVGKSQSEAADLGNQLAKLGIDIASLKGDTDGGAMAFTAMQAALRGEFDPLERYNVFLNAAAVTQEALSMGLIKSASQMNEQAKKAATLSLIMKGTVDAQGDLERSQNSAQNTANRFWGTLENLGITIGQTLLPAYTSLLQSGTGVLQSLGAGFESNKATFEGWVASVVAGVDFAGVIFRNLGDIFAIAGAQIGEGATNTGAIFVALGQNIVQIAGWIADNWYNLITDALSATATGFQNFTQNLVGLGKSITDFLMNPSGGFNFNWTPLLEGFQATTSALPELIKPELVSVDNQIAEIQDRMAAREAGRLGGPAVAGKGPGGLTDAQMLAASAMRTEPKEAAADKFKSEIMGSAEFASKLRMAQGADDVQGKQLNRLDRLVEQGGETMALLEQAINNQVAVLA